MNCSTLGGLAVEGGFRRSSLRFTQSQEGFKRRHFQVQATETLSPLLVAEQKSLGELTRDDFPILNQVHPLEFR